MHMLLADPYPRICAAISCMNAEKDPLYEEVVVSEPTNALRLCLRDAVGVDDHDPIIMEGGVGRVADVLRAVPP